MCTWIVLEVIGLRLAIIYFTNWLTATSSRFRVFVKMLYWKKVRVIHSCIICGCFTLWCPGRVIATENT